jgi:hypothetical protein
VVPNNVHGGKTGYDVNLNIFNPHMWKVYWHIRPAVSTMFGTDIPSKTSRTGGDMADPVLNSMFEYPNIDNLSYDLLLSQNIVFLELVDCSTSNTIIECIVRNTPILINRHPAVVELLGERYPFYYNNLEEASSKSNNDNIVLNTHNYLRGLDKSKFELSSFINSIKNSKIYRAVPNLRPINGS